jgi:hypothetical protein
MVPFAARGVGEHETFGVFCTTDEQENQGRKKIQNETRRMEQV